MRRTIRYDYLLWRDEGIATKTFKPGRIDTELPNLVYIEGPNSCGKSTLLNIIALGLHGLKKEGLNPALKNKMNDLVNSDHQKLQFEFRITNRDNSITLVSSKSSLDNREIILREVVDGKESLLTPDLFHRKYNLMYDIPDNPTERLKQLVQEIKENQKTYYNRLGAFRNYVLNAITEIRGGRDPKRIEALRTSIGRSGKELDALSEEIDKKQAFLDLVERFAFSRLYANAINEHIRASESISTAEKKVKDSAKSAKKVNKEYQQYLRSAKSKIEDMNTLKSQIASQIEPFLSKDEKPHLKIWNKIDLDKALDEFEVSPSLESEILAMQRILVDKVQKESGRKELTDATVYSDLIEFLSHYRNSDIILPGIEKTIDEFLTLLEEHYSTFKVTKVRSDNLNEVIEKLGKLREQKRTTNVSLGQLKIARESYEADNGDVVEEVADQEELDSLGKKLKSLEESCETYEFECRSRGITDENLQDVINELNAKEELDPYRVYDDKQLKDMIDDLRSQIMSKRRVQKDKENAISVHKGELARLEKMQPHKYQDRLEDLEALFERIKALEQKVGKEFDGYITCIINKGQGAKKTESEARYMEAVARYLGHKVGYIRHIENEYKVKVIDLVAGTILTEDGTRIRLTDMGTGQSQSAYLVGLLNTEDNRKIIALFDEVAHMDKLSLEPVYEKFRHLYEKNRLLVGIVVQKAESVKVIPKEGRTI